MAMQNLFEPWKIGSLTIQNRVVRSATFEGLSTRAGLPTQRLIDLTVDLAKGGVGLIIAGSAYISREGQGDFGGTGIHNDDCIKPLSLLCESVHKAGGVLATQLLHCGSTFNPAIRSEKDAIYGPSAMIDPVTGYPTTPLSKKHILKIVEEYANAALRAQKAGFDAVQIHVGHGYLVNQFLSPSRNLRTDEYGGSLKHRCLLLYQIYEAVRGRLGKEFPIFIKLSAYDGFPGGVLPEDAAQVAAALDNMGIDAIEVTAGTPEGATKDGWDHILPAPFKEGSLFKYALQIKEKVSCPVISVEGWRTPYEISKGLDKVDAIAMCRPFIREPDLVSRWQTGDLSEARCISCNKCLELITKSGLGCVFQKSDKQKQPFQGKP